MSPHAHAHIDEKHFEIVDLGHYGSIIPQMKTFPTTPHTVSVSFRPDSIIFVDNATDTIHFER